MVNIKTQKPNINSFRDEFYKLHYESQLDKILQRDNNG